MKKILFGLVLFTFSLCMYANGSPLSAAESFVEKMRQYVGHALSSDEIRQVLVGNTLVRDRTNRMGTTSKVYRYYPTAKIRELHYTTVAQDDFEGAWSAKPGEGYCHENKNGGTSCYSNVRVVIEGDVVKFQFIKRRTRTWTLLPGKHTFY